MVDGSLTLRDKQQLMILNSKSMLSDGTLKRILDGDYDNRQRIRRDEDTNETTTYCSIDYSKMEKPEFVDYISVTYSGALLANLTLIVIIAIGVAVALYLGVGKPINKVMAMIKEADTDGDGKVSLEEVLGFATKAAAPILGEGGMVGDLLSMADNVKGDLLGGNLAGLGSKAMEFATDHMGDMKLTGMLESVEGMVGKGALGDMLHVGVEASKLMTDEDGNPLTGDDAVEAAKKVANLAKAEIESAVTSIGGDKFIEQAKQLTAQAGGDPMAFAKLMADKTKDQVQAIVREHGGEGALAYAQDMAKLAGADPKAFATLMQSEAKAKFEKAIVSSGGSELLETAKKMASDAGADPEAFAKMLADEAKGKLGDVFSGAMGEDALALSKQIAAEAGADPIAFVKLMEEKAKSKVNGALGGVEALEVAKEMAKKAGGDPAAFSKLVATHTNEKLGDVLKANGGGDTIELTKKLAEKAGGDSSKFATLLIGEATKKYDEVLSGEGTTAADFAAKMSDLATSDPEAFAKLMVTKAGGDPESVAKLMIASNTNPAEFGKALKAAVDLETDQSVTQKSALDFATRMAAKAEPMLQRARLGSVEPSAVKSIQAIDRALALAANQNTITNLTGVNVTLPKSMTGLQEDVTLDEVMNFAAEMSTEGKQLVAMAKEGKIDREALKTFATLDTAISLTVSERQKAMLAQAADLGLFVENEAEVHWKEHVSQRDRSRSRVASTVSRHPTLISRSSTSKGKTLEAQRRAAVEKAKSTESRRSSQTTVNNKTVRNKPKEIVANPSFNIPTEK